MSALASRRRAGTVLTLAAAALAASMAGAGAQGGGADPAPAARPVDRPAARAATGGGDFDFYILALSWSPTYCAESGARAREQCGSGARNGFVVHGLWPEYTRGRSPQNCDSRSPTRQQIETIHGLYPEDGLARYEWRVHGSCSGKSPTEYYADVKTARGAVTIPAAFTAPKSEQTVATAAIARAFIDANKGLRLNAMAVTCRSGALQEVRLCMSKDLRQFVTCQQISRSSCRAREVSIPPVH